MERQGQLDVGRVFGVIGILVAIIIGGLVFATIHEKTEESVTGTGTTHENKTTNSDFTTGTAGWDNYVMGNAKNEWNSEGYIATITTDADAVTDNGVWHQGVTVPKLYDEIKVATATFKYRLKSDVRLKSVVVKMVLDKCGVENVVLYSVSLTERTTTWTTIENDIKSHITATGAYRLYLRAELLGGVGTHLMVEFDDASLTIQSYEKSVGEKTATGISTIGAIVFAILPILALVGIVFLLIWSFGRGGT